MKDTTKFNIFDIIGKDNKELMHSQIISHLLHTRPKFREIFIKGNEYNQPPKLEVSYTKKEKNKTLRCRIDIELKSDDEKAILFIENKFKSFPEDDQLVNYNKIFKEEFTKDIKLVKYLFCFDKTLYNLKNDSWKIYDYEDFLKYLETDIINFKPGDEKILIQHYILFLKKYIDQYKKLETNCSHLYKKGRELNKDDKFWLKLLNSKIALLFKEKIHDQINFNINPGNTATPLLNIIPTKWKEKFGEDLLIQFQVNKLSFYLHSSNKEKAKELVEFCDKHLWSKNLKLKKVTKRKVKSCYIFTTSITDHLSDNFKLDDIINLLVDFYNNINDKIVKNYNNTSKK